MIDDVDDDPMEVELDASRDFDGSLESTLLTGLDDCQTKLN